MIERINCENDIHKLTENELPELAHDIRAFLIDKVSKNGGHLASNLGVVELTIALHRLMTFPEDKLIWDVGHQAYTHKILTGRKDDFDNLRQLDGLSGFPKREESHCDSFDTGHSTTSISAGLGYVRARDLQEQNYKVVSVIGDGSLTGGMAYEAFNNAAVLKTNFVTVLNDNHMSISRNVGGMAAYLGKIRTAAPYTNMKMGVTDMLHHVPYVGEAMINAMRRTKSSIKQLVIPGMFFENLGITYLGPVDGHDISQLTKILQEAFMVKGPVIVHVITKKGKGYEPAERHPDRFHGIGPFDPRTGKAIKPKTAPDYTDVFSDALCRYAAKHPKVAAITAAMPEGTGLKRFSLLYPNRYFDVGIAEEHAVTFAAGLAAGGLVPVVAIYSSFMQRAFDQMMMDVCMQNLHVVFVIRGGLSGNDGETHQGCFDLSYLSLMPNMKVLSPMDRKDLVSMLTYALECRGPVAIRIPRGTAWDDFERNDKPVEEGRGQILIQGEKTALLSVGSMTRTAVEAAAILKKKNIKVTVADMRFVKPLDEELLKRLLKEHDYFVTLEENVANGGFGEKAAKILGMNGKNLTIENISIPDRFIRQGNTDELLKILKMDAESIVRRIINQYENKSEN